MLMSGGPDEMSCERFGKITATASQINRRGDSESSGKSVLCVNENL